MNRTLKKRIEGGGGEIIRLLREGAGYFGKENMCPANILVPKQLHTHE